MGAGRETRPRPNKTIRTLRRVSKVKMISVTAVSQSQAVAARHIWQSRRSSDRRLAVPLRPRREVGAQKCGLVFDDEVLSRGFTVFAGLQLVGDFLSFAQGGQSRTLDG